MLKVSLVTVTYNSAVTLRHCWSKWPSSVADLVVVDNNSDDGSADVAELLGARVVRLPRNVGFSAANNVGVGVVGVVGGDVIGFLNPDVRPTLEGVLKLAAVATEWHALVAPQWLNSAMDAAIFAPRAVLDLVSGWDFGFFVYYEDSDLCLRALNLGIPTVVAGDVRWHHGWGRETAKSASCAVWVREVRSAARFYRLDPYCLIPVGTRARQMRRVERQFDLQPGVCP